MRPSPSPLLTSLPLLLHLLPAHALHPGLGLGTIPPTSTDAAAAPTLDQLSVRLSADELASQQMSPDSLRAAADALAEYGVVRVCGALPEALADACADAVDANFDECTRRLGELGIGIKEPFAYRQICHRAPGRYDMQLGPEAFFPLAHPHAEALATGIWQPLLTRVLGRDMRHNFDGVVVAEPGAAPQQPHMDGGHLFHSTHGFSIHLPVHIVNVFLPLVDLPLELGPTEFWPRSHVAFNVPEVSELPSVPMPCDRGDAIIFDYRTYHRGMPNLSGTRRPMLYQTYSRSWFRDAHNFPPDASLADPNHAQPDGALPVHNPSTGFVER